MSSNPLFYEEHCLRTYNFVHFSFVFHVQTALLFFAIFFVYVLLLFMDLSVAQLYHRFFLKSWAKVEETSNEVKKLTKAEHNRANWVEIVLEFYYLLSLKLSNKEKLKIQSRRNEIDDPDGLTLEIAY